MQPGPDDIVITGMSGTMPASKNIEEFEQKLYNKVDLTTPSSVRGFTHPEIPPFMGFIPSYEKFDAGFFGIHRRQALEMDPQTRISMEKVLEAIFDSGMHPSELENTNTGVFTGSCFSESEVLQWSYSLNEGSLIIPGHLRSLMAQRTSYFLKLKGPSFNVDTACSSSLFALEHAFQAMRENQCDRAIVFGTNLCFHPGPTIQFFRLGVLSPTGVCSPFDESGNGYVRSDTICAIVLQKAKYARRMYAQLVYAKSNCDGYKEEGITYPSGQAQMELLKELYEECKVSPSLIGYVEAHGTGTKVGDPEECHSIDTVFTKNRDKPLLIGSVKSSIGHTEGASGVASVVKAILALENEQISPNLNFKNPKSTIKGIIEGRLSVVANVTKFPDDRKLIGINSFGFGGGNCHALLRGFKKQPLNNKLQPSDNLPRLVCLSGRTQEAVSFLLDDVAAKKLDHQQIYLLHHIFRKKFLNHQYNGYIIVSKQGVISKSISYATLKTPSLYLYFGELNNWYDIIKDFQEVPIFKKSLQRIESALTKKLISLKNHVLTDKKESRDPYDILGQIIVHICIADLFKEVITGDIEYVDSDFGKLISSYSNKKKSLDEIIDIALKLDEQIPEKQNAVHTNGKFVVPINGDVLDLRKNKEIKKLNGTEPRRKQPLDHHQIILQGSATKSSTKNSNSVLLQIGCNKTNVKYDEETIEKLTWENGFEDFLKTIGSLYQIGYEIAVNKIYPKIEGPIIKAPGLHSKILWNHNFKHTFSLVIPKIYEQSFCINIKKSEWSYITGHNIDGRILFPAAGYLYLTWELVAKAYQDTSEVAIIFENCRFMRATAISEQKPVVILKITLNDSGRFEISEGDTLVVTGRARITTEDPRVESDYDCYQVDDDNRKVLTTKDIYKELRLRGYNYSGAFRSIKCYDRTNNKGRILWAGNFVTFLDNLFQMKILLGDTRLLYVPTELKKMTIFPKTHYKMVKLDEDHERTDLPAYVNPITDVIRSGGIEVHGLIASSIPRRKNVAVPVLESYQFIPNDTILNIEQSIRVNTQILLENCLENRLECLEIINGNTQLSPISLSPIVQDVLADQPTIRAEMKVFCKEPLQVQGVTVENGELRNESNVYSLIVGTKLLQESLILDNVLKAIKLDGYILSRESQAFNPNNTQRNDITILTVHRVGQESLVLFSRKSKNMQTIFLPINLEDGFTWLPQVQAAIKTTSKTVLYAENDPENGLLGFVNCLRREPDVKSNVSCFLMLDKAIPFQPKDPFYINQLNKNMAVNIYKNGCWGTYRHLQLDECENIIKQHCYVNQVVKGDLSSLRWMEGPIGTKQTENVYDKTIVNVHYAALNFRDVMLASGKISADIITTERIEQECVLGFEFSGIDSSGKPVMGMIPQGALSTVVQADPELIWNVPKEWSLADAATVPAVYGTVIYALDVRAKIQKGDSILIHSGVGGVGQAAIRYALYAGCTVYTTVGNEEKKLHLQKLFPELPSSHIGNSHDLSFERMIMRNTNRKGVDVVLNSLAEEKLTTSVRCLAKGGKFLEIGKFDISLNNSLNLALLKKNCSFHGVMLDKLFKSSPAEKLALVKLLEQGIKNGAVKPLNTTIFGYDDVEQAFRYMAGGKHMGKVLIEVCKKDEKIQNFEGIPRYSCDSDKSYIIIGGLGGFGLELADWMVLRGAKKLVLVSRNGVQNGYQQSRVETWMNYGANVQISTANVSTLSGCKQVIETAKALGPVGAVYNLAAVLEDAIFENQTEEKFKISLTPKAVTTKYFDELTRSLCPELSDFVVFSSVSCGRGNPGQTNYGMANSIMERICEERRKAGYPALAIEWGAIGEVGLVAEMQVENIEIEISGTLQQKISSCLQVMDLFLRQKSSAIVSSMVVAEKKNKAKGASLVEAVAGVLGINDLKAVSHNSTLAEIGMDSMTAVEIKQLLETDFEVFLTPKEIRNLTLARLEEIESDNKEPDQNKEDPRSSFLFMFDHLDCYKDKTVFNIPIVKMATNISDNQEAPAVLAIPGVEGFCDIFEPVCSKLNAHVYGMQVNYEDVPETIHDMAQQILPYAEHHFSRTKKFRILSYSYGSGIAFELASLLEARGYSGQIIVIDGSPTVLKLNLEEAYVVLNQNQITDMTIAEVIQIYTGMPELAEATIAECRKHDTIEEKFKAIKKIVEDHTKVTLENLELFTRGVLKRVSALRYYTPSFKAIKSKVTLLKAAINSFNSPLEDDGLSELCQQTVKVVVYEGNHHTILENEELINYVNDICCNE